MYVQHIFVPTRFGVNQTHQMFENLLTSVRTYHNALVWQSYGISGPRAMHSFGFCKALVTSVIQSVKAHLVVKHADEQGLAHHWRVGIINICPPYCPSYKHCVLPLKDPQLNSGKGYLYMSRSRESPLLSAKASRHQ